MSAFSLDDLPKGAVALLAELARIEDAGEAMPGWKDLGARLDRDGSNVRKSVLWLKERRGVTLDGDRVKLLPAARTLIAGLTGLLIVDGGGAGTPGAAAPVGIQPIALDLIERCDLNPRKTFNPESLKQLAASIASNGLLQPLLLRPHPDQPGFYQIAAGERRWRAMTLNAETGVDGWAHDTPVNAVVRALTDLELLEVAIAENRDREDVPPLEEAEAYRAVVDILDPRGERFEAACAHVGERAGFSGRHVEKRVRLCRNLSEKAREALTGGRLNLAAANELAAWPHAIQNSALANIRAGYAGWKTAVEIRHQLRAQGLPAEHAIFERDAYDGPVADDDDGLVYADRAQAQRLQEAALPAHAEQRAKEGWADVFTGPSAWYNQAVWPTEYFDAKAADPDAARARLDLILRVNPNTLRIDQRTALQRLRNHTPASKATPQGRPAAGPDGPRDAPDGAEHQEKFPPRDAPDGAEHQEKFPPRDAPDGAEHQQPTSPYGPRNWRRARLDKTVRLQVALATAPVRFAQAVTLCALFSSVDFHGDPGAPGYWITGYRRGAEDADIPPAALAILCKAATEFYGLDPDATGIDAAQTRFAITDAALALPHLLKSPALERLFAAAMAAQAGSWCGNTAQPGDHAFVAALKAELGDLVQPWTMSEAWLSGFTIPQLARIADACTRTVEGEPPVSAAMPKKKDKAVAFILNHVRRDTAWTPPDMHFTSRAAVQAGADSLMNGEG